MSHESVSPAGRGDGPGATPGTQPLSAEYDRVSPEIPIDALFRALSNPQRRRVLKVLADRPGAEIDVETLRDAAAERTANADAEPEEQRRRAAMSLQTQLRTLADLDLVEYDEAAGVVTYRENPRVTELLSYATLVENLHTVD